MGADIDTDTDIYITYIIYIVLAGCPNILLLYIPNSLSQFQRSHMDPGCLAAIKPCYIFESQHFDTTLS